MHEKFVFLFVLLLTRFTLPAQTVWWEGESTLETNFPSRSGFEAATFPQQRQQVLSAGDWLTNGGERAKGEKEAFARYQVEVPADGTYHFWVRKFWKHGPFRWRFGEQEWRECGREVVLHDGVTIRLHLGVNWVYLGEVELTAGPQEFELRLLAAEGEGKTAAIDAFVLSIPPFVPRGKLKPGESAGAGEPGWFVWDPPADLFQDSPLDLRALNEPTAGMSGHVRREGNQLVLGDGRPVRFWTTQAAELPSMRPQMRELHARRLAKYGHNLVRLQHLDLYRTWRQGDQQGFQQGQAQVHAAVAALKAQGIYTYLGHLFWDTHVHALSDDDLPGLRKGEAATAALFFNEELQEKYLEWLRDLLTPVNPHTGLSLAEDPAVAVLEIQNESNTLFWTLNPERLPAHTLGLMERAFADFAAEKHGSLEKAFAHWGRPVKGDDLAARRAGLLSAWFMTTAGISAQPRRAPDQIEFLHRRQVEFYQHLSARLRAMGVKCLIAGSNWKTADPANLGPLESHSYTATDLVIKNEYFSPHSLKSPRFHSVDAGDEFVSLSAMRAPEIAGVLMTAQPVSHPYMIGENNWDNPNEFRAEFPFLVATYGAMAGIDVWNFFAHSAPLWDASIGVWTVNSPVILGQYPAFALMFRRGDVQEGPPAVLQRVNVRDLYQGRPLPLPEIQYKDAVWKATLGGDPKVEYKSTLSPLAFFAGPVRIEFTDEPSSLVTADLDQLIDRENRLIRNTNGQLTWQAREGVVRVNTPASQGAAGFLGAAGILSFPDVVFELRNDYAVTVAVSLDGKPLATSERILVQTATRDKPRGFQTEKIDEDGGRRITALGGYPYLVQEIAGNVLLRGKAGWEVRVLDANGYPRSELARAQNEGEHLRIELPKDSLYLLIQRPAGAVPAP